MGELKRFVDRIVEDGVITAAEHEEFMTLVHEDGEIDEREAAEISRIFRLLDEGKVKIVDHDWERPDRDALEALKAEAIAEAQKEEEERALQAERPAQTDANREAIAAVVKQVSKENGAQRNTIAEFLNGGNRSASSRPRARGGSANAVLEKAKRRTGSE